MEIASLIHNFSLDNTSHCTYSQIVKMVFNTQLRPVMTFNKLSLLNGRNYWYKEWCVPWTNTWPSTKYFVIKCSFQPVNIFEQRFISLVSLLECLAQWSKMDHSEIWSFVKCGFLPSSCISHFVIMVIIYKPGQELLLLKVAPIQSSMTTAFHLQSWRNSNCQMWELAVEYHVCILQVLLHLSCGDTHQNMKVIQIT